METILFTMFGIIIIYMAEQMNHINYDKQNRFKNNK